MGTALGGLPQFQEHKYREGGATLVPGVTTSVWGLCHLRP